MIRKNWIYRIIKSFINPDYREDIEGDLNELYDSSGKSGWKKMKESFQLLRPGLMYIPINLSLKNKNIMLQHYAKIAIRGFMRNRLSSLIGLLGLSLGLACSLLGYLYIDYQTSFDQFQANKGRLYRIVNGQMGTPEAWVKTAAPFLPEAKSTIPEIEAFTRFENISFQDKVVVETGDNKFLESFFMMADPNFFSVFSYPLIKGKAEQVLSDPSHVVITERIAHKLFGDDDPLGKLVKVDGNEFLVSGIAQNPPERTHLNFDYLVSFENLARFFGEDAPNSWGAWNYYGYVLLRNGADMNQALEKMRAISHQGEGYSYSFANINLQPITKIHFEHNRGNLLPATDPRYLWIFGSVSLFVLIIALANYINLTIATSIKRTKEYGVRKALGAAQPALIRQLLSETIFYILAGVALAFGWVYILLPSLNTILNSHVEISFDRNFILVSLGILFLTTLLSSGYLAVIINNLSSVEILKGKSNAAKGFGFQKVLLAIQFLISIILIINSLIIHSQLNFMTTKDIGMNPEGVLNIPLYTRYSPDQLETMKTEIGRIGSVVNTAASTFVPGEPNWHQTVVWDEQTPEQEEDSYMYIMAIDRDFVRTMDLQLVYGSLEDIENTPPGQIKYLINESGLKFIGWDTPEGKKISPFGPDLKADIVGVVKDFNFKSLHDGMDPLLMPMSEKFYHRELSVRIKTDDIPGTIDQIKETYGKVTGGMPFEFYFMNDKLKNLYHTEREAGMLISVSTLFAMLLATMGLFGIVSFTIEEKTKEIAIRKILGISLAEMLSLFSRKYLYILGISALAAWPISWFVMETWLSNFAYRIDISVLPFILGALITLLVIMGVVGLKMFTIQRLDAVKALKYE